MPLLASAQTLGARARKTKSSYRTKPGRHDFRKTLAGDPLDAIGDLSTVQNVLFSVAQPAFYDKVVVDIGGMLRKRQFCTLRSRM